MKVVFFTPRPFSMVFGGSEVQMLKTKQALERLGVTVLLADPYDHRQLHDADVLHFFGSDFSFFEHIRFAKAQNKKVVVSSIFYPVGRTRFLQTVFSRVPRTMDRLRLLNLLGADIILPNSQSENLLLQRNFGLLGERISVVPNGVDRALLDLPLDPKGFVRKHTRLGESDAFVLSVGRIEKRKNSLILLQAAMQLQVPVVFVGRPVEFERQYVQAFFDLARTYPHFYHVEGLPSQSGELMSAFAAAQVHALVSHLETPGLASLEAGMMGANLVVGDCGPVREYFEGFAHLAAPLNLRSVVIALTDGLSLKRNAFGQAEHIVKHFGWDRVAELTLEAYRKVLSS